MSAWKDTNYSPQDRTYCEHDSTSPYEDILCHVPAYTPARLPQPPVPPTGIPRVIFTTHTARKISRGLFTSLSTLIHHNPEYELLFFTHADTDRFLCDTLPTSAARTNAFPPILIERYGGVYLDIDTSALAPLPIRNDADSAVVGVGCTGHLPSGEHGAFAHRVLAYAPHHAVMRATVEELAGWTEPPPGEERVAVGGEGPGPYQTALHRLLGGCGCRRDEGGDYCGTLMDPKRYCGGNYSAFRRTFGNITMTDIESHNLTLAPKLLQGDGEDDGGMGHVQHYDALRPGPIDNKYCSRKAFGERKLDAERRWNESLVLQ